MWVKCAYVNSHMITVYPSYLFLFFSLIFARFWDDELAYTWKINRCQRNPPKKTSHSHEKITSFFLANTNKYTWAIVPNSFINNYEYMYVKHSNCCSIQSGNGKNLNTKKIEVKKNKKKKVKSYWRQIYLVNLYKLIDVTHKLYSIFKLNFYGTSLFFWHKFSRQTQFN